MPLEREGVRHHNRSGDDTPDWNRRRNQLLERLLPHQSKTCVHREVGPLRVRRQGRGAEYSGGSHDGVYPKECH